jgi:hypothetical protein
MSIFQGPSGHAQARHQPRGHDPRRHSEAGWRDRGWRGGARSVAIERDLRRPYFFLICSPFSQSRRIGRLGWQSRPRAGAGPEIRNPDRPADLHFIRNPEKEQDRDSGWVERQRHSECVRRTLTM